MDDILKAIRTKSDAEEVLAALESFSANLFVTKEQTNHDYFSRLHPELAKALEETLTKEPLTQANREIIKEKLREIRDAIEQCKTIQMTVAFHPDEQALSAFSSWVKTNAGKDFLIDMQFDRTIIGGALIVANGLYKDYSMRKKVADVFQVERDKIMAL